jgi:hypothetical protein
MCEGKKINDNNKEEHETLRTHMRTTHGEDTDTKISNHRSFPNAAGRPRKNARRGEFDWTATQVSAVTECE